MAEPTVDAPLTPGPSTTLDEPVSASMMAEHEEERSWFSKFWGIVLMIFIIGSIIGIPLWWVWARSPLRTWLKIVATLLLVGLLVLIL